MLNLILCGGSGTRLWPVSRELFPKQFVKLFDNQSLFELTVTRNMLLCNKFITISNKEHKFYIKEQIETINDIENINFKYLFEPVGRNTAPAIALACLSCDEDEIILVTPSDHIINDNENYVKSVKSAVKYAKDGYLVTFGILPAYAETGYGYIEAEAENDNFKFGIGLNVISFKEKPDLKTAEKYIAQNKNNKTRKYFWNSGMFCFKAKTYLNELKKHSPEIYEKSVIAFNNAQNSSTEIDINYDDMIQIPSNSIDYAVMEKSNNVVVIPSDIKWNDLGSFDSLYNMLEKNEKGNAFINTDKSYKSHHPVLLDSKNNMFITSKRLIAGADLEDLMVVDTRDALLITKRNSSQKVKDIVKQIQDKPEIKDLTKTHVKTNRPWGSYTVLDDEPGYKIKTITVKPGKRLSLQKHFHRSEHWIVVKGTALVTIGNKTETVRPNESTYIKIGELHRLENPGKVDLIMVEVQVGEYTEEDDIVRYDDDFDRKTESEKAKK